MQISDTDLEYLEATDPRSQLAAARAPQRQMHTPLPLYDVSLAQAPADNTPGLFSRKIGPLPVWGWGLIVTGVAGAGYAYYRISKASKVKKNDGEEHEERHHHDDENDEERPSGGWSPSRTAVGKQLERYLMRKGLASRCKVYTDADDADKDKDLKTVSPLVTIKVTGTKIKLEKDLDRMCKREGLSPTQHEDGSIGLYPTTSKRGKEWESYIDALRDDGQER